MTLDRLRTLCDATFFHQLIDEMGWLEFEKLVTLELESLKVGVETQDHPWQSLASTPSTPSTATFYETAMEESQESNPSSKDYSMAKIVEAMEANSNCPPKDDLTVRKRAWVETYAFKGYSDDDGYSSLEDDEIDVLDQLLEDELIQHPVRRIRRTKRIHIE